MNILVTGAAGYIGSVVTERLVEQGHEVVALDNLSHGHRDAVHPAARFLEGDLLDRAWLIAEVQRAGARCRGAPGRRGAHRRVGARSRALLPRQRHRRPQPAGRDGRRGRAAARVLVDGRRLRRAGSGRRSARTRRCGRSTAYGESKLLFERALPWYHARARPAAPLAPLLQRVRRDPAHAASGTSRRRTSSRSCWMSRSAGATPSSLFGTDYDTPDGTCIRDYVHVLRHRRRAPALPRADRHDRADRVQPRQRSRLLEPAR